ncbi:2TM domain-containing protein [Phytohabitans suffuscus]|uniref:2TM domain-containing protein n=1 Tax=Phytohabitans suffuscus TaxID=624315 RepID=A0A6F8YVT1_9ACTN|nr:2TM domain-containing protein [Phytohabitans suffuscus]BCB89961.1 hypothetical protein Psuf_072740 [Phytohabitans suffuscus]
MTGHKSRKAQQWGLWSHVFWYVAANLAQVIVWWFATPDRFFWPLWSILGWGIGLLIHIWAFRVSTRSPVRP